MKSVLISIQPKWCELIASGKKTIEVRKTKPKLKTPFKVYIYCTKGDKNFFPPIKKPIYRQPNFVDNPMGNGKVIGEFVCDKVVEFENSMYEPAFQETSVLSCVDFEELALYLGKKDFGYGWHISNLVIYDKPRELYEFQRPCDNDCENCEYLDVAEVGSWEHTAIAKTCLNFITRPPQSYCYVESECDNNG